MLNISDIVHFDTMTHVNFTRPVALRGEHDAPLSAGAAASGVKCGADSLDAEGENFTATPYCETVVVHSLFTVDNLVYRSVKSVDQAGLEMPDTFSFVAIGSGSGFGSISFGSGSWAGIDKTTELGYVNSFSKDMMAFGQFNISEGRAVVVVCEDF